MNIFQKLEAFVTKTFKTTLDIFLEAIRMSPNAQGYVSGSITELLLKQHIENLGCEVKRIKEKWEGKKTFLSSWRFLFQNKCTKPLVCFGIERSKIQHGTLEQALQLSKTQKNPL